VSYDRGAGSGSVVEAVPVPRTGGHRLGRLATSDADVNIRLLSRLAETAVTSGDIKTAIDAVRACTAEAENLYRIAASERSAAAAAAQAAAEQHARAMAMQEAAAAAACAAAEQHARAMAMRDEAAALQARAAIMRDEAAAQNTRALAIRDELAKATADFEAQRKAAQAADLEAQRKADQRRRTVPRRLRVSDANGLDLRPDPSTAQTPAEYIEALRQFRLWAGNPSFRDLAKRCDQRPVASTICKILQRGELPSRWEVIDAIIIACGATEEDRQRFATAWRRLILPERKARSVLYVVPGGATG
jgi:hypothetical protein